MLCDGAVTFSEAIDSATVTTETVTLKQGSTAVEGALTYTLTVTTGVKKHLRGSF